MKIKNIYIGILILILISLILLFIDKNTYKEYSKNYFYMDTYISIKINSTKNKKEMDKIFSDIDYIYSSYHKLTSRYDKYDGLVNVYYLNELLDNDTEVEIDSRLSDIINIGILYYKLYTFLEYKLYLLYMAIQYKNYHHQTFCSQYDFLRILYCE